MKDDERHDVRQFQVGDGRRLRRTAGDGGGRQGTTGDGAMPPVLVLRSYLLSKFRK